MARPTSVWIDLFVAPHASAPVDRATMLALTTDLLQHLAVSMPWSVLTGMVDPSSPMGMASIARGENKHRFEDIQLAHSGYTPEKLLPALHTLPAESEWLLWFKGLNWSHPEIGKPLKITQGVRNGDLMLVSLNQPKPVLITNAYSVEWHEVVVQHYMVLSAPNGPRHFNGTVIDTILKKHFGDNYQVQCGYS